LEDTEVLRLFYEALGRKPPRDLRPLHIRCDPSAEATLLGAAALGGEAYRVARYLCPPQYFRSEAMLWYRRLLELGENWREKVTRTEGLRFLVYIVTWNDIFEKMAEIAWQRSAPRPYTLQPMTVITTLCTYIRAIAEARKGAQGKRTFIGGVAVGS
jgi:hypothetical protein